jgi:two-component system, sensor histidine kinase and response regulator
MNFDKNRHIEQGHGDVCHETGLPIRRKPEWTDVRFGKDYTVTVSIVGDNILRVQPSGYVTLKNQINVLKLTDRVPAEAISGGQPYVHIEDWSNFRGASLAARKYYIDAMPKRNRITGVIFCHTSSMFKMSIKLGKRLSLVKFPVHIVDNYSEAVRLAHKIESKGKTFENKPVMAPSYEKNLSKETFPFGGESTCPVTSLPVTAKPEWTDIRIDDKFSVSFRLIGKAILCTVLNGSISITGAQKLLAEREKVIIEAGLSDNKYAEIVDYSLYAGYPSREVRIGLANFLVKEAVTGNLLGFWVFAPPLFIKWMFSVGIKLYKKPAPASVVRDYKEAVGNAVNVLEKSGVHVGVRQYKRFTKDEWGFELDNYSVRFEMIGDDILYNVAHGAMKEAYVAKFFELYGKVLGEAGLKAKGYYYRIINWENLEKITWKARKMYIDAARDLNKKIPCRFSVLFGLNKFMRTIIGFSKQFVPVPVATARNFEEAMALIERERKAGPGSRVAKSRKRLKEGVATEKMEKYSHELLQYMGNINWDREGAEWEEISDSHPFKAVFDAISIIKADVDDLFRTQKQIEKSLAREEEKYRTILENIEDGYFEVDLTGSLTFFNNALCRITGLPETELMGINNREYMDEETARKLYKAYVGIFQTGVPIKGLEYTIGKEGIEKNVETSVSLMKDGNGRPVGFRGIIRDVTERKRAEETIREYNENLAGMVEERTVALKKSEEKYRTILENIEDGYYEVDLAGNMTFFNDSVCKITGYSEDELMGMNNRAYTDEKNAQKLYGEYNRVYETGIPTKRLEWEVVRKDGTTRFMETSISLIRSLEGRSVGFRGILRDVSERKRLEGELIEKKRLAEEATRAKSEFLANMSHEIRTPLNGIIGMAELAMDTDLDDNQKNIFHTINTEADSLLEVINRILDFSKIEAGKLEIEEIFFDLRYLVEEVAGSLAYRAEQMGIEVASYMAPDFPSRFIGDPGRVRQILVNLTGNALKFTKEGEIYITVEMLEDLENRVKVRFSVKDTGIGIPKEKQTAIFESFVQVDGSTTREYGGTGLGTTISKQLTELMGGEIGVESEEGKGSTFWFTAVFSKETGREVALPKVDVDLSDLKVLVVGANQTNRFILIEYLRSWDCMPVAAEDGFEALDMLRASASSAASFDLILMAVQMLEMNDFELIPTLRKMEALNDVPIIVLTSLGRQGDGKLSKDLGVAGYLTKPVRRDDLHQAILMAFGGPSDPATETTRTLVTKHTLAEERRKNGKILLVEDYPTNQEVAMRHLRGAGYHVDLAENGKQGFEAFRRCAYDIILMDMQMPVMNGYEATAKIREHELKDAAGGAAKMNVARIPIVAMTANATSVDKEKCMAAGTDDYIAKPVTKGVLLAMVDKWFRSSSGDPVEPTHGTDQTPSGEEILAVSGGRGEPAKSGSEKVSVDAPMDYEKALAEYEGDQAFLTTVLNGFLERAKTQMQTLRQALSSGDAETVREEAHAIKGGSGILMADALSGAALELETMGRSGTLEGGFEVFERMERELRLLGEYSLKKGGIRS